ncbi:hypothetical protein [Demetria terragena]|uniref:hypothetical protein n=1 Tax=Demetria terragena TaxID=63959 RepID=UPI0003747AA0|nr:hypothetical protein [Demetria terragena]
MKREGVKRMVTGGVFFFLLAPLVFVVALVLGVGQVISGIDESTVPPGGTIQLDSGAETSVFVLGLDPQVDTETGSATALPDCTVKDPSGSEVALSRTSQSSEVTSGDQTFTSAYSFTPAETGAYTVTCGTNDTLVIDSGLAGMAGKGVILVFVAIGVPFIIGIVGLGLFIWGLVKYNSSKRRMAQGGPGPHGYPYNQQPPPYYNG